MEIVQRDGVHTFVIVKDGQYFAGYASGMSEWVSSIYQAAEYWTKGGAEQAVKIIRQRSRPAGEDATDKLAITAACLKELFNSTPPTFALRAAIHETIKHVENTRATIARMALEKKGGR